MIRKFATLSAPRDRVAALFGDVEGWPGWMAGVSSAEVVRREADGVLVRLRQTQMGRSMSQRLRCRATDAGLVQTQVEGPFRHWEARWRFLPPPDGDGTTVALELEMDLGMAGLLVPRGAVQRALDRMFSTSLAAARTRLAATPDRSERSEAAAAPADRAPVRPGEVLLAVWRRGGGLEVEVAGRRFRIGGAADP